MICKICEQDKKGKRNVCLECKTKYPVKYSSQKQEPFNRKKIWLKEQAKNTQKI